MTQPGESVSLRRRLGLVDHLGLTTRGFLLSASAFGLVFLGVLLGMVAVLDHATCASHASGYGFPYRWGPFSGCFVHYRGRWWDYDQLRTVLR